MNKFEKIIFLDIDGVLNIGIYTGKPNSKDFDVSCVSAFNALIKDTGARVVITSSNRILGLDAIKKWFKKQKVECEIIDSTSYGVHLNTRGEEIFDWIAENFRPDTFVIIDDKNSGIIELFGENFIKTESKVGFGLEHYEKAKKILNYYDERDISGSYGI